MYTKIDTEDCIARLSEYLRLPSTLSKFKHYSPDALTSAIEIVMRNNRMRFGDIIVKQLVGIAMGMSPAPTIANLYVAIYEARRIVPFIDDCVFFLRRFVDDGLGIWLHDPDPLTDESNWTRFKTAITSGGLGWTFTHRSPSVEFMDLTITIAGSQIETSLFEKPLSLTFTSHLTPAMPLEFRRVPLWGKCLGSYTFALTNMTLTLS